MISEEFEGSIHDSWNRIRGRMLGLIESFGLPEKQENSAKQTFKSLSYDAEAEIIQLVEDFSDFS